MRHVWVVVRREFVERVRTKGFIIGTLAVPVLALVLIAVSAFLGTRGQRAQRELALVDFTGFLAAGVAERLEGAGYTIEVVDRRAISDLETRVAEDELYGYLVLDDLTLEEGVVVFRGKSQPGTLSGGLIRTLTTQAVLEAHLGSSSDSFTDVGALLGGGTLEFEPLGGAEADASRTVAQATGVVGAFLLYITMIVYGTYVLRSVMEEKRNRLVEIIVSAIRPWQLMLGKIIGVGAVGLTQMTIWIGFLLVVALMALPNLVTRWPALEGTGGMSEYLPGPGTVLLFLLFYVLGYFLYSGLFAAVGAVCTRDEEAQQAQFPVMMLLVIPMILQMMTVESPGFGWVDWAALFPFFSPILMFPRAVSGAAPPWMVGLSIVLMVVALVGTAYVAGRIYRVGILMQGKRPTLPEILRWLKEA